jgi:RNA polymerase primary sigma factor
MIATTENRTDDAVRIRTRQLMRTEISFISSPEFDNVDEAEDSVDEVVEAALGAAQVQKKTPTELPSHLYRLCESDLLTHEQETALFREMNRLKYRASSLQSRLDPDRIDLQAIEKIDLLLDKAQKIRDHITKANMRLVMSIAKKYVTPQLTFDEMLSDGVLTLMQAVEKFDYDRGFRFSTYAYRSIVHGIYRSVATVQKEELYFTQEADQWAIEQQDDQSSSSMNEQIWHNLRKLTASMLDQLDRRERFIIRSRYALGFHRKVRTLQFLADKLGISKERVRQLEKRAVSKLNAQAQELDLDQLMSAGSI